MPFILLLVTVLDAQLLFSSSCCNQSPLHLSGILWIWCYKYTVMVLQVYLHKQTKKQQFFKREDYALKEYTPMHNLVYALKEYAHHKHLCDELWYMTH